jgi:hypothetical protein
MLYFSDLCMTTPLMMKKTEELGVLHLDEQNLNNKVII